MPNEARAIAAVAGDMVAAIGTNHKMVIFPLDQVPEMARGRGVRLQKYTSASLSDVTVFDSNTGLTWKDSAGREQSMSMKELADWRGNRADAGRLAHGLPKSNRFGKALE
jgi:topoisomerase-4 subunit A